MGEPKCPTIYFLANGDGAIKIGYSTNPRRRIDTLRTASSRPLEILGTIDGSLAQEREIHKRLSAHRGQGEWFDDCVAVRSLISELISGRTSIPIPISPTISPRKPKPKKQSTELRWPDFDLSDLGDLDEKPMTLSAMFDPDRLSRALASFNEARNERIHLEKELAAIKKSELVDRKMRAAPAGTDKG